MPDDCIVSYDYKGNVEENSHAEIHDLYGLTSYLENFGRHGTDGEVKQSVEYKAAPEDLGPSNDTMDIGGEDYGLF